MIGVIVSSAFRPEGDAVGAYRAGRFLTREIRIAGPCFIPANPDEF
jgi:hypothetical protein